MKIGEKISQLLGSKPISKKDLSKELGISRGTLDNWIAGESFPDANELQILAKFFNISIAEMYEEAAPVSSVPSLGGSVSKEVFMNSMAKHADEYRLVHKALIDGPYRMMLESEIQEMKAVRDREIAEIILMRDREMAKADKIISLLEARLGEIKEEMERERKGSTSPRSKHGN